MFFLIYTWNKYIPLFLSSRVGFPPEKISFFQHSEETGKKWQINKICNFYEVDWWNSQFFRSWSRKFTIFINSFAIVCEFYKAHISNLQFFYHMTNKIHDFSPKIKKRYLPFLYSCFFFENSTTSILCSNKRAPTLSTISL